MRLILIAFIAFIFIACSDNSTSSSDSSDPMPPDLNSSPLFYQQWSINYNSEFYSINSIDENAHINPQDILLTYSGIGVKVAVIDDGFDVNHPQIRDKIIKTIGVDENGVISSNVSHTYSSGFHGSSVTGIIASADDDIGVRGISPDVELILVKMPMYNVSDYVFIEVFKQAVDAGADVINCSWGSGDVSDAVRDYIDEISTNARDGKGVIVVFASGNGGEDGIGDDMGNDESAIDSVVGVGATSRDNLRTKYSNYGKDLDIVAPGGYWLGISTIDPVGSAGHSEDEYSRYDETRNGLAVSFVGTSASAPIITSVVALALQKNSDLTRVQIQELLKKSTTTIGQNTPYLDDMIVASSSTPLITGLYGLAQNSEIKVKLISHTNSTTFGPYSVESIGNSEWSSTVIDTLEDGNYTIRVVSDDETITWATDESFEVNSLKTSQTDKSKRKSDFYGYGKIDLYKLMDNIISL